MDAAFNKWDQNPDANIPMRDFLRRFREGIPANLLSDGAQKIDFNAIVKSPKTDAEGMLVRADARRILEIQMGVRRNDGKLLRFPNGHVVDNSLFILLDPVTQDLLIDRERVFLFLAPKEKTNRIGSCLIRTATEK